jgi:hypothetical protein
VRWREYPTKKDRDRDLAARGGTERTGTTWSAGPSSVTKWVVPDGDASRFVLVHVAGRDPARWWSVAAEDMPRGARP